MRQQHKMNNENKTQPGYEINKTWISTTQYFYNLNLEVYQHHEKQNLGALVDMNTKEIVTTGSRNKIINFIVNKNNKLKEIVISELEDWNHNKNMIKFPEKITKKELLEVCDNKECFTIYPGGKKRIDKLVNKQTYLMNGESKLEFKCSELKIFDDHFEIHKNKYYVAF